MIEIERRRRRALEAALDGADSFNARGDWMRAIEVATRVTVTDEAIDAFGKAWHEADESTHGMSGVRRRAGLRAALAVLGFEVIE